MALERFAQAVRRQIPFGAVGKHDPANRAAGCLP
jgi:hypothetical protein